MAPAVVVVAPPVVDVDVAVVVAELLLLCGVGSGGKSEAPTAFAGVLKLAVEEATTGVSDPEGVTGFGVPDAVVVAVEPLFVLAAFALARIAPPACITLAADVGNGGKSSMTGISPAATSNPPLLVGAVSPDPRRILLDEGSDEPPPAGGGSTVAILNSWDSVSFVKI